MFYYNNGKLQIFANTRCGNTNMHHHFNLDVNSHKTFPTSFSNDLVVVLRNPLDRMESAVKGISNLEELMTDFTNLVSRSIGKELTKEFITDWMVFYIHCNPYLHRVFEKPFRIIDFNRLGEYIPRKENAFQSPVTNSSRNTDPKSVYVENQYFTLEDLEREYELYLELLLAREQISVAEWKEKTL